MLMLLAISIPSAWAAEVSWAFKTLQATSGTQSGITWETGKTGSATATACTSTNGLVLYGVASGGGYFQTTSAFGGAITNVNIESTNKKNTPKYTGYRFLYLRESRQYYCCYSTIRRYIHNSNIYCWRW